MMEFLSWLYSTIPFIQLFGNRFNIVGFFWFATLTFLTFKCLKESDYSFGSRTKWIHYVGLSMISIFTVWVFYRALDELLTIFTVLSWDAELLSFSFKALTFWVGKALSYFIVFLGFTYLFNFLELHQFFELKWYSWIILVLVSIIQRWSVGIFKVDYAVLPGIERIEVFWTFYPLLYVSYALLYVSMLNRKVMMDG